MEGVRFLLLFQNHAFIRWRAVKMLHTIRGFSSLCFKKLFSALLRHLIWCSFILSSMEPSCNPLQSRTVSGALSLKIGHFIRSTKYSFKCLNSVFKNTRASRVNFYRQLESWIFASLLLTFPLCMERCCFQLKNWLFQQSAAKDKYCEYV